MVPSARARLQVDPSRGLSGERQRSSARKEGESTDAAAQHLDSRNTGLRDLILVQLQRRQVRQPGDGASDGQRSLPADLVAAQVQLPQPRQALWTSYNTTSRCNIQAANDTEGQRNCQRVAAADLIASQSSPAAPVRPGSGDEKTRKNARSSAFNAQQLPGASVVHSAELVAAQVQLAQARQR